MTIFIITYLFLGVVSTALSIYIEKKYFGYITLSEIITATVLSMALPILVPIFMWMTTYGGDIKF